MPLNSEFKLASAGAGKTTEIIELVEKNKHKKILVTTYTNENLNQIKKTLESKFSVVPSNIKVLTWYRFLLREYIRPFMNMTLEDVRVNGVFFESLPDSARYAKPNEIRKKYLTTNDAVYKDNLSKLALLCSENSEGKVIERIKENCEMILLDEFQDLAGAALDIVEQLIKSGVIICGFGDPRQSTFFTAHQQRLRQYKGAEIYKWLEKKEQEGILRLREMAQSYRCNQAICDFADLLFPEFPATKSLNEVETGHDGVFPISLEEVKGYIETYKPKILRFSKTFDTFGYPAINIKAAKGSTFDRVLIIPTKKMVKFWNTRAPEDAGDRSTFYVGVTRARYSVGIVMDNQDTKQLPLFSIADFD